MLTAAVRDLHRWHPQQFLTDVRTTCPELWDHNPHISPLSEEDPDVEQIDCSYPLIDRCNQAPYHCLHGFIEFLSERLSLSIKPTAFKGDIHLSKVEKQWFSQVHELAGNELPFWIVTAGGKYDITIKWWESGRYQEVVDHFRGRIQFVQVGEYGHHHPKLNGVVDLRGQTDLRQLIRLVHHSQGILCSVTALMHLAAAVATKQRQPPNRPCVVIAGGREPAHWEAYPDHQFIHTNGALSCCSNGGCWKDRVVPLRDGDERDWRNRLCVDVVNGIPHCMGMITPAEVIRRIEMYFQGGAIKYLSPRQRIDAARAVAATADNEYDDQPLNLHNAGLACDRFVQSIPPYPDHFQGRGIVICGGGVSYFTNAWVCINMLRHFGCKLPIEVWHLGRHELDEEMEKLLVPLGVECVDASEMRKRFPTRLLKGWELKPYAILQSSFREVFLLDADNVPVVNPEFLFESPEFGRTGAVFWPDFGNSIAKKAAPIWKSCGLRVPKQPEFETGQIVLDKQRCWRALRLSSWFNENSDFYYRYLYGDKETFHLAFRILKQRYALIPTPIHPLEQTMCQHDFNGRRIFQHRNQDKWDLFLRNREVKDFWFEQECRSHVARLRLVWSGSIGTKKGKHLKIPARRNQWARQPKIEAVMISCPGREQLRRKTLENLAKTDWGELPVHVQIEKGEGTEDGEKQTHRVYLALKESLKLNLDYILLLDDALEFNRNIRHNLNHWGPLQAGAATLAGLHNQQARDMACDVRNNVRIVDPNSLFGSHAFLISGDAVKYIVKYWNYLGWASDIRIPRLAGRLRRPIFYHAPSLVRNAVFADSSEEKLAAAKDFDPDWAA